MSTIRRLSRVLIGIQARSTSERLPRKAHLLIGEKRMLDHVIDGCWKAAKYLNRYSSHMGVQVEVAVLTPKGDEIATEFHGRCDIIEGPEDDVLTRYVSAADKYKSHYIVRVTGDCPLIPPYLITKHVKVAVVNGYDYLSNVEESIRLAADGTDCEVLSRRLLNHLDQSAISHLDREHVTTLARRERPEWARMGAITSFFDNSGIKLSVDTPEDLERVRDEYKRVSEKYSLATHIYGKQAVHKL